MSRSSEIGNDNYVDKARSSVRIIGKLKEAFLGYDFAELNLSRGLFDIKDNPINELCKSCLYRIFPIGCFPQ